MRYEPDTLTIEVSSPAEGYLVLSDPFYPGWRADVDGHAATLLQANYAFRAVAVPPGVHRVTMSFQPVPWLAGLAISALTVLVLLILLGLALWRERRGQGSADRG